MGTTDEGWNKRGGPLRCGGVSTHCRPARAEPLAQIRSSVKILEPRCVVRYLREDEGLRPPCRGRSLLPRRSPHTYLRCVARCDGYGYDCGERCREGKGAQD